MNQFDHGDLLRRALIAYLRKCSSENFIASQPNSTLSKVELLHDKLYVVMRNVSGTLAIYRVRNDGVLRSMKRWPPALNRLPARNEMIS